MTQEDKAHPARSHQYITSFSGHKIRSLDVSPWQIERGDMIRGLAMQVRYLGQIRDFYSIAEHVVLVAKIAREHGESLRVQRMCFLHDGHEYISGDFPSPYKYDVPGLRDWEADIEDTFRMKMGLPDRSDPDWAKVKRYDLIALHHEAEHLMRTPPEWLDLEMAKGACGIPIECLDWRQAARRLEEYALELGYMGFQMGPG